MQKETTLEKLKLETNFLEEKNAKLTEEAKAELKQITNEIKKTGNEVALLELQLKEKEQALKLNELKLKELRKHIPHNRLRPIQPKVLSHHQSSAFLTSLPPDLRFIAEQERISQFRRFSR